MLCASFYHHRTKLLLLRVHLRSTQTQSMYTHARGWVGRFSLNHAWLHGHVVDCVSYGMLDALWLSIIAINWVVMGDVISRLIRPSSWHSHQEAIPVPGLAPSQTTCNTMRLIQVKYRYNMVTCCFQVGCIVQWPCRDVVSASNVLVSRRSRDVFENIAVSSRSWVLNVSRLNVFWDLLNVSGDVSANLFFH